MALEPITLTGQYIQLEPLTEALVEPLWAVADDPAIWRYMPFHIRNKQEYGKLVTHLLAQQARGETLPFATRLKSGQLVGSTSYLMIDEYHRRLEIGSTWVAPAHQRSPVNTEAKLLQLTHAFEALDFNRVEFKTDSLNEKSRMALARIGAQEEGTFRNHMVMPDGRLRHSVYFAVIKEDWPAVKAALQQRLG